MPVNSTRAAPASSERPERKQPPLASRGSSHVAWYTPPPFPPRAVLLRKRRGATAQPAKASTSFPPRSTKSGSASWSARGVWRRRRARAAKVSGS